ncbi:hypothetical protein AB0I22_19010 [Streptomyces sp. NPDC050610]|uniref:hypothetical protein n=1 Tax=Streptomyces sp. NPDC050610 TaxID=3157097 RepID=UPI0034174C29
MARRHLRLTAVVALVLVSLTGFSRGHGHGHGSHGSYGSSSRHRDGGGGCSSSHSNHSSGSGSGSGSDSGSSSGSGYDYGSSGSSGSSGSYGSAAGSRGVGGGSTHSASPDRAARPEAKIVQCISDDARHEAATIRVTNRGSARATYTVTVDFRDRQGASASLGSARLTLGGGASGTVRVSPTTPSSDLASCRVRSVG